MFTTSKTGFRPISGLLIDVPNAQTMETPGGDKKRINVSWQRFCDHLLKNGDLTGTDLWHAGAYAQAYGDAQKVAGWIERTFKTFGEKLTFIEPVEEFFVIARGYKDVDSLIIGDLLLSLIRYEQRIKRTTLSPLYPIQLRHILVSGDSDYLRVYRELVKIYGNNLELELIVYARRDTLSGELANFATKVHYLEDIPGFDVSVLDLEENHT